eukprot:scaffold16305_cov124-Isochrysis_galbana.AAC.4
MWGLERLSERATANGQPRRAQLLKAASPGGFKHSRRRCLSHLCAGFIPPIETAAPNQHGSTREKASASKAEARCNGAVQANAVKRSIEPSSSLLFRPKLKLAEGILEQAYKSRPCSPPLRIPTAAASQTDVAVVSPCTSGRPVPSVAVPFQMEAAPRKPTPEGTAAATRDASHDIGPERKANMESIVKTQEPRQTIAIVRMPAARSARRRSHLSSNGGTRRWVSARSRGRDPGVDCKVPQGCLSLRAHARGAE